MAGSGITPVISIVKTALDICRGNQVRAARLLGISRNTLRTKLRGGTLTDGS